MLFPASAACQLINFAGGQWHGGGQDLKHLLSATTVASPAAADEKPPTCSLWHDQHTFGASCTWSGVGYEAKATCSNGSQHYGPLVKTGWSYVYCSTYGANYVPGTGGWTSTNGGLTRAASKSRSDDLTCCFGVS